MFAGSFELEAAERICDADLDTLQSLIDKSLVRQARTDASSSWKPRASTRSNSSPPVASRTRSAPATHAGTSRSASPRAARARTRVSARTRLRHDTANVGLALAWALDHDIAAALPLADSLFLTVVGDRTPRGAPALVRARARGPRRALAAGPRRRARRARPRAHLRRDTSTRRATALTEALALFAKQAMSAMRPECSTSLGGIEFVGGSPERMLEWREQALEICERLGDPEEIARSLFFIAEGLRDARRLRSRRRALHALDRDRRRPRRSAAARPARTASATSRSTAAT